MRRSFKRGSDRQPVETVFPVPANLNETAFEDGDFPLRWIAKSTAAYLSAFS